MDTRRIIMIVLALGVLAGAFGIASKLRNSKKPRQYKKEKVVPAAFIQEVKNEALPLLIPAGGSLNAKHRINLFAEVQGVLELSAKEYKPGTYYAKGETLVKLNSDEFYTNLQAQKSNFYNSILSIMPDIRLDYPDAYSSWQQYLNAVQLDKKIKTLPKPKSEQEKLFIAAKGVYTGYYNVRSLEEKYEKFTLKAPFSGILTEASITPGTLVSPGQNIGEFIMPGNFELELALSSSLANSFVVGDAVEVSSMEENGAPIKGKIIRINGKVDQNSQTVSVFVQILSSKLKDGMFLKAMLKTKPMDNIMEIKRNLLVNENQLYVYKDSNIYLQDIQVVHQNEKTIMVSGLKDGELILERPIPKAFHGMHVKVFNEN